MVYIVRGLLDWKMTINTGGAILRFHFSGGTMGPNGVVPARYCTDNEALQKIIENSEPYRKGMIRRVE